MNKVKVKEQTKMTETIGFLSESKLAQSAMPSMLRRVSEAQTSSQDLALMLQGKSKDIVAQASCHTNKSRKVCDQYDYIELPNGKRHRVCTSEKIDHTDICHCLPCKR